MRYLFCRFTTSLFVLGGLVLLVVSPAHAKTYTVTVTGRRMGSTEQSIGATEGCTRFVIEDARRGGPAQLSPLGRDESPRTCG